MYRTRRPVPPDPLVEIPRRRFQSTCMANGESRPIRIVISRGHVMVAWCPAIRHRCPRARQIGQRSDPSPEHGEVAEMSSTGGKKTRKSRRNLVFYGVNRSLPVIRGWHGWPAVLWIGTALAISFVRSNESQQLGHGRSFTAPLDNGLRLGRGCFPLPNRTHAELWLESGQQEGRRSASSARRSLFLLSPHRPISR